MKKEGRVKRTPRGEWDFRRARSSKEKTWSEGGVRQPLEKRRRGVRDDFAYNGIVDKGKEGRGGLDRGEVQKGVSGCTKIRRKKKGGPGQPFLHQ